MPKTRVASGIFGAVVLLSLCTSHAQECVPAPVGLVSWWPGDGNAADAEGGHDGVLNGTTFEPGIVTTGTGQAFSFDGTDDHVDFGDVDAFEGLGQVTYEFWMKTGDSEQAATGMLLSKADGATYPFQLILCNGTTIGVAFQDQSNQMSRHAADFPILTNTWTHVAGVFDNTQPPIDVVKLYIDGALQSGTGTSAGCITTSSTAIQTGKLLASNGGKVLLGARDNGAGIGVFFRGEIDEVGIYDRALSDFEIQTIVNDGSRGKCKDVDGDGFRPPADCDDLANVTYPGAPELFDGLDNDCDGSVDEDLDADADGIPDFKDLCPGTPTGSGVDPDGCAVCTLDPDDDGDGFPASVDCDDADASVNPGVEESCNGIDDDCDGLRDEGFDQDGDGFSSCQQPNPDCDDADATIHPEAVELPGNSIDENCDGSLGACDPNADYANHGQFVRCVAQEVEQLVAAGVVSEEEGNALVKAAARSGVGR